MTDCILLLLSNALVLPMSDEAEATLDQTSLPFELLVVPIQRCFGVEFALESLDHREEFYVEFELVDALVSSLQGR